MENQIKLSDLSKEELKALAEKLMLDQIRVFKAETKRIVEANENEEDIHQMSKEMTKKFQEIQREIDIVAAEYKLR